MGASSVVEVIYDVQQLRGNRIVGTDRKNKARWASRMARVAREMYERTHAGPSQWRLSEIRSYLDYLAQTQPKALRSKWEAMRMILRLRGVYDEWEGRLHGAWYPKQPAGKGGRPQIRITPRRERK